MKYVRCSACGEFARRYRNEIKRADCGPVVIEISRIVRVRRKLRELIESSGLPIVVFSQWVLGRDARTAQRYLAGGKIPQAAACWIDRLERVHHHGDTIILELTWYRRNPRWGWRTKKERIRYGPAPSC